MPLPPLLLDRLKRRKIIQEVGASANTELADTTIEKNLFASKAEREPGVVAVNQDELEEEIIAEDYSDEQEQEDGTPENVNHEEVSRINSDSASASQKSTNDSYGENSNLSKKLTESVIGCPNKYNIYHDCSQYCVDRYAECKNLSPTLEQRKQLALVMKNYPMTSDWKVVFDPGVQTFYFWNTITNLVSWFPPSMNGLISFSADQIRKAMKEVEMAPDEPYD